MESWRYLKSFILLLVMVLFINTTIPANSATTDDVYSELAQTFTEVHNADRAGADVKLLVQELNSAAGLINAGGEENLNNALVIISKVRLQVPNLISGANQANFYESLYLGVTLVFLVLIALLIWVYGSKIYWGLWVRVHGNWRVERP